MTSLQADIASAMPANMAYEEIDFADRPGEDDIDIDIDLSTDLHDEDYIIEDVHSDAEPEEAIVYADDLMIDDENASYTMDGVDIVQDESFETLRMEYTEMPASYNGISDVNPNASENSASLVTDFKAIQDVHILEPLDQNPSPTRVEDENALVDQTKLGDVESASEEKEVKNSTSSPNLSPVQPQQAADPHTSSSPAQHASETKHEVGSIDVLRSDVSSPSNVSFEGQDKDYDLKQDNRMTLLARRVVVMYRDTEYGLVSSSDSDDPDSFFLEEAEVVNGPMGDLLRALREVINDDLASDDELCLAIDDLGMEISETCTSVNEMNLASIFDLYANLLHNDGVEEPVRFCVTLGTKPDFAKRLASLATGASEGKGFSELISWNERNENLEGSQSLHDEDISQENNVINDQVQGFTQSTETLGNAIIRDATAEEHPEGDTTSDLIQANKAALPEPLATSVGEQVTIEGVVTTGSHDSSSLVVAGEREAGGRQVSDSATDSSSRANDDVDEDGDLIDYEDEEFSANLNHVQNGGSANELNVDSDDTKPADPAAGDIFESNPNDVDEEKVENLGEEVEDQQLATDIASRDADENNDHFIKNTGNSVAQDSIHVGDISASKVVNFEQSTKATGSGDEGHEEINYNIKPPESTSPTYTDIAKAFDVTTQIAAIANQDELDEDEISYEEAEIAESNESEQTMIAEDATLDNEIAATEQVHADDEINYESDEQQDSSSPTIPNLVSDQSPVSNEHGSKRPRAETDDFVDRASQQSKRVRS